MLWLGAKLNFLPCSSDRVFLPCSLDKASQHALLRPLLHYVVKNKIAQTRTRILKQKFSSAMVQIVKANHQGVKSIIHDSYHALRCVDWSVCLYFCLPARLISFADERRSTRLTFHASWEHFAKQNVCSAALRAHEVKHSLTGRANFFTQSLQRAERQSRQLITQQRLCHWQRAIQFDKLFRDAFPPSHTAPPVAKLPPACSATEYILCTCLTL